MMGPTLVEVRNLETRYGSTLIHNGLSFDIHQGEVMAIIGGSGSGKTTLLRCLLLLKDPFAGSISLLGEDIIHCSPTTLQQLRRCLGVAFQYNALFSSLSILENVRFPLDEFTNLDKNYKNEIALLKLKMVGLDPAVASKLPSELSGGMQKRVSVARALALEPDILFLDEPTSGLDPVNARKFDRLVQNLREMLGLTIVMVTHDRHSLDSVDRILFLGDGKILAQGRIDQLLKSQHPLVQAYFEEDLVHGK